MNHSEFSAWMRDAKRLTPRQRERARNVLDAADQAMPAKVAEREKELDRSRKCVHCGSDGVVKNGKSEGLVRFRCRSESCRRTYNALTGTNLKGLVHKEKWELYEQCMRERLTLKESARRCGISYRTAFHWRHRFLKGIEPNGRLNGVVELDETNFRESGKGDRTVKDRRCPRERGNGGEGGWVPVVTAVARGSATRGWKVPDSTRTSLRLTLQAWLDPDSLLVTDGHPSYSSASRRLGLHHEILNQRAGERRRGSLHLNTVNNRHLTMKKTINDFHRGVSTRYLDNYVAWLSCSEFRVDKSREADFLGQSLNDTQNTT